VLLAKATIAKQHGLGFEVVIFIVCEDAGASNESESFRGFQRKP
jgi:hypothetical protein